MNEELEVVIDESLLEFLYNDLGEQCRVLENGLVTLEENPDGFSDFDLLMRAAHSIKGMIGTTGMAGFVDVAHRMEDYFVAYKAGQVTLDTSAIDVLLRGVQLFDDVIGLPFDDLISAEKPRGDLVEKLREDLAGILDPNRVQTPRKAPAPAAPETSSAPETATPASEDPEATPAKAEATPAEPTPGATSRPDPAPDEADRVLRVSAENLNRLLGLAGESLVASRTIRPFSATLLHIKQRLMRLEADLHPLQSDLVQSGLDCDLERRLGEVRDTALQCQELLSDQLTVLDAYNHRVTDVSQRLYREVVASRMRPFGDALGGLKRMARDVARAVGKKVRLEIVGESTRVDRDILDRLEAPLGHMVRNAIDHGLELPETRAAAGKPEQGEIRVSARHSHGVLAIEIRDDGSGVAVDKLRQKILRSGRVDETQLAEMDETELFEFLFLPDFSTREEVTKISGRGVGLDVVHTMLKEVGGSFRVDNEPGSGLAIHLELPVTLSVIRALLVRIAGEPYALPLTRIDRTIKVPEHLVETFGGRRCVYDNGEQIGLVSAAKVLEIEDSPTASPQLCVVVVGDPECRYGLIVDRLIGQSELVIQPLDPRLGKLQDVSAAAVLDDGAPVLILDVPELVRTIEHSLFTEVRVTARPPEELVVAPRILVVDDSITARELQRKTLESRGYEVDVAVDGRDAWNRLNGGDYDLVVSDVEMPRMDGLELIVLIRQDPRLRSLPVIMVTCKDQEEDRAMGLRAGADRYLTKGSFHDDSYFEAVVDLIGKPDS